MRLWSIHPKYLDPTGLVAVWRESLLARKVLSGQTKGYRNHPQLIRFRDCPDPIGAIDYYLSEIFREAEKRSYSFDRKKFGSSIKPVKIKLTRGQLDYEFSHLLNKLSSRSPVYFKKMASIKKVQPNPLFIVVPGPIAIWEVTKH